PKRARTEPGAAALVRERKSPAADAKLLARSFAPADATGTDDHDTAIGAVVGAHARRVDIGCDHDTSKWMRMALRGSEVIGLGRPSQCRAADHSGAILRPQAGGGDALFDRSQHRRETFFKS